MLHNEKLSPGRDVATIIHNTRTVIAGGAAVEGNTKGHQTHELS